MLIDSCVLGFERNGESHVPQKTLKPSNPVFLLGLTGVLYPFSCKSQVVAQFTGIGNFKNRCYVDNYSAFLFFFLL